MGLRGISQQSGNIKLLRRGGAKARIASTPAPAEEISVAREAPANFSASAPGEYFNEDILAQKSGGVGQVNRIYLKHFPWSPPLLTPSTPNEHYRQLATALEKNLFVSGRSERGRFLSGHGLLASDFAHLQNAIKLLEVTATVMPRPSTSWGFKFGDRQLDVTSTTSNKVFIEYYSKGNLKYHAARVVMFVDANGEVNMSYDMDEKLFDTRADERFLRTVVWALFEDPGLLTAMKKI
jgi:hypothetical protein